MSVEKDIARILGHHDGTISDWGRQARTIADGVRESGLVGAVDRNSRAVLGAAQSTNAAIESSTAQIELGLSSIASLIGVSSRETIAAIAVTNNLLRSISETLRNPRATAADERFRMGLHALEKGWNDDAEKEFRASVAQNPYAPLSHAYLGVALSNQGKAEAAAAAFAQGAKYGTPDEPHIAAGCALAASSILGELGKQQEAAQIVYDVLATVQSMPELGVRYSQLAGEASWLIQSLWLAPELAVIAVVTNVPGAEEAAQDVASRSDGPVARAKAVQALLAPFSESRITEVDEALAVPLEGVSTAAAMSGSGRVLQALGPMLERLRYQVESGQRQSSNASEVSSLRQHFVRRLISQSIASSVVLSVTIAALSLIVSAASQQATTGVVAVTVLAMLVALAGIPMSIVRIVKLVRVAKEVRRLSGPSVAPSPGVQAARQAALAELEQTQSVDNSRIRPWVPSRP